MWRWRTRSCDGTLLRTSIISTPRLVGAEELAGAAVAVAVAGVPAAVDAVDAVNAVGAVETTSPPPELVGAEVAPAASKSAPAAARGADTDADADADADADNEPAGFTDTDGGAV